MLGEGFVAGGLGGAELLEQEMGVNAIGVGLFVLRCELEGFEVTLGSLFVLALDQVHRCTVGMPAKAREDIAESVWFP